MLDFRSKDVNIIISDDGKKLWVNVGHKAVLRVYDITSLEVNDGRSNAKVDPEYLDDHVLTQIIKQMGWKSNGDVDEYLERVKLLTVVEAFDKWLRYEGFIGYTEQIIKAFQSCLYSSTIASSEKDLNSSQGEQPSMTEKENS